MIWASNQTRFEVLQPLHRCSVGYQLSTNRLTSARRQTPLLHWSSTKHNFCKRIEEHKQEGLHVQSEIADLYEMKIKRGSSSDHKRTNRQSGEEQEQGP